MEYTYKTTDDSLKYTFKFIQKSRLETKLYLNWKRL